MCHIKKNSNILRSDMMISDKCHWIVAPLWRGAVLTGAAEPLFPQTQQHALTHVAVNGLVEVFHPPKVLPVFLGHLIRDGRTSEVMKAKKIKDSKLFIMIPI